MFNVFGRFNPLLAHTRVQNAMKEFQMQLIATVTEAIERLQTKFTQKYESSSASRISRARLIPPVSGKILWVKQIERQVIALMKCMENVLGKGWCQHLEGRQLRRSGDELLKVNLMPSPFSEVGFLTGKKQCEWKQHQQMHVLVPTQSPWRGITQLECLWQRSIMMRSLNVYLEKLGI